MTTEVDYGPDLNPSIGGLGVGTGFKPVHIAYDLFNTGGRQHEAEAFCRRLLLQDPKESAARHILGLLEFQKGLPERAIEELRLAVTQGPPPQPLYLINLGLILSRVGRHDEAIQSLERACAMEPENLDFNNKLAAVVLRAGRLDQATTVINRSLQIKSMDMQALDVQRQIKRKQTALNQPGRVSSLKVLEPSADADPYAAFAAANYSVTISARTRRCPVNQMLTEQFGAVPLTRIDSVFGFHRPCRLYGGRNFTGPEIDDDDLKWMYSNSIGFRIPLTNKLTTQEDYEGEKPFLAMHHRTGNSVIVFKDEVAKWIRRDFPLYKIEASVIRETNTADKLFKTLEIFDTVVPLPEAFNTNYDLLAGFPQDVKDRIRLFLNAGCAYHCPRRICYLSHSRLNRQEPNAKYECSQTRLSYHFSQGMTHFPMERYIELGYKKFKLLRVKGIRGTTAF